jgi:general stress protein 26
VKEATAKQQIIQYLNQTIFATLITTASGSAETRARLMIFGNNAHGEIFLCSRANSALLAEIRKNAEILLAIHREEINLEDMASLIIRGQARILDKIDENENYIAYDILGQKSPHLGSIPQDGKTALHRIIVVSPKEIKFQKYTGYLHAEPPLRLARASRPD